MISCYNYLEIFFMENNMWFRYYFWCKCLQMNEIITTDGSIREKECCRCHTIMKDDRIVNLIQAFEDEACTKYLYGISPLQGNKIVYPTNQPQQTSVKCPYCQSTKCTKIGQISRTVSTGFWGLGSSKVGKQWHCNTCKSDF